MSNNDNDNTMARTSSNTKPRSSKPAKAKVAGVTKKKVRFAEPLTLSTTNATLVELMARHNHAKPADATTIKARPKAPLITIPMDVFNDVLATTIKKEAVDPNIAEEVAVDHSGTAPSTSNKKVGRSQTRPRPSSSTPSTAPSLFLPTSYLPPPKPSSSTRTPATRRPTPLHRPPPKYVLNPPHLHFRTTGHPALYSHHHLPFTLDDDFYDSLDSRVPLNKTLQEKGLRTNGERIKIVKFRKDLSDKESQYLVEGHFVQSGATANNKDPDSGLLRPEWLLAGATECGKCGSWYGRIESGKKTCNRQIGYHQGTLTKRSRSKKTPGMILPSTISTCKAVDRFIYATD